MFKKPRVEGEVLPKRRFSIVRMLVAIFVAAGIFYFGVAVGQGRIVFGRDAVFHKSVSKNLPSTLDYSSVERVYDSLRTNYDGQLDINKLLDGLKTGLVNAAGNPYTEYLNPKDAQAFDSELNGTFTGIGAELGKDANSNLVVIAPIAGFPAEKAGLKAKDLIEEIDGQTTANMSISDAVNKIRGPKDTTVKLKIVRGSSQELTLTITRDTITIPSVK